MTELVRPTLDLYDAWADCVRDFGDPTTMHGSGAWWIEDFGPDRPTCERLIAKAGELRSAPPEGLVASDCYWVTDGDAMVGTLMLRHALNDFLLEQGGHIGYSIRPSCRRQGHASRALGLALDRAGELGLDRVLVTCDDDNVASARTIESQGGVLEDVRGVKRRYWIDL